jgi:hypothetical protein
MPNKCETPAPVVNRPGEWTNLKGDSTMHDNTPDSGLPERLRIKRAADGDEFLLTREVLLEEGYTELEDGTLLRSAEVSE